MTIRRGDFVRSAVAPSVLLRFALQSTSPALRAREENLRPKLLTFLPRARSAWGRVAGGRGDDNAQSRKVFVLISIRQEFERSAAAPSVLGRVAPRSTTPPRGAGVENLRPCASFFPPSRASRVGRACPALDAGCPRSGRRGPTPPLQRPRLRAKERGVERPLRCASP